MHSIELQSWAHIWMNATTAQICNQSEPGWLDLSEFRDVVIWVELAQMQPGGGTITLNFQTGASKDDALFTTIASLSYTVGVRNIVQALPVHSTIATVPLAKWLRWQLVSQSVSSRPTSFFRVWISAARSGRGH